MSLPSWGRGLKYIGEIRRRNDYKWSLPLRALVKIPFLSKIFYTISGLTSFVSSDRVMNKVSPVGVYMP